MGFAATLTSLSPGISAPEICGISGWSLQSFRGKKSSILLIFVEKFLFFIDFIPGVANEDFPGFLGIFEDSERFLGALMGIFPALGL